MKIKNKKLTVLFISPFDLVPERFWGPTLRLFMLAKELTAKGHEVYLLGPAPFNRTVPKEMDGVKLITFRSRFYRYDYAGIERQTAKAANPRLFKALAVPGLRWLELEWLVTRLKPDFMVVNRAFPETGFPALLSHFLRGIPLIYDWDDLEGLHGFSTNYMVSLPSQLFVTVTELVWARFSSVTLVASRFLEELALKIWVDRKRVVYAPTVADTARFHPGVNGEEIRKKFGLAGKTVLLYTGNLEHGNGVKTENILYVTALLAATRPGIRLLVVGGGSLLQHGAEEGALPRLVRDLDIQDKVIFTGNINYSDVPNYIAAADICLALFPINVITMAKSPLKIYEYMAMGKPVVARAVGEIPGAIQDGHNGFLVFSDNPREYADKINQALENKDNLQKIGAKARETVEQRLSWRHSAETLLDAFAVADEVKSSHGRFFKKAIQPRR
ncbi:MAG: glycosyltransferase family 4 protein [Deltaproteobacteria bacterium]|nr:glycosyltransferase family 4 protein [Deltaproteobacteria bacterium]